MTLAEMQTRIPAPSAASVNTGLNPASRTLLRKLYGEPRESYTTVCQKVTNDRLANAIETRNVGPFKVTGLKPALDSLERLFARVKKERPDLYVAVGTAGMLCARYARGTTTPSIHSWGAAIDLTFGGVLDPYGDGTVQRGLLEIYRFFRDEGWYWGAEFSREDGMHFEIAKETLKEWLDA